MLQFQQHLFRAFFCRNVVMCCAVLCDVIYHPVPINSQYLKTWGVDSPDYLKHSVLSDILPSLEK